MEGKTTKRATVVSVPRGLAARRERVTQVRHMVVPVGVNGDLRSSPSLCAVLIARDIFSLMITERVESDTLQGGHLSECANKKRALALFTGRMGRVILDTDRAAVSSESRELLGEKGN